MKRLYAKTTAATMHSFECYKKLDYPNAYASLVC